MLLYDIIWRNSILLAYLILSISTAVSGAKPSPRNIGHYHLENYTDETGLPQNSVKAILSAPDGFTWLATEQGLVRFDGQQFRTYDRSVLPIKSNRFVSIHEITDRNTTKTNLFAINDKDEVVTIGRHGLPTNVIKLGKKKSSGLLLLNSTNIHPSNDETYQNIYPIGHGIDTGIRRLENKILLRQGARSYTLDDDFIGLFYSGPRPYLLKQDGNIYSVDSNSKLIKVRFKGDILKNNLFLTASNRNRLLSNSAAKQAFLYLGKDLYLLKNDTDGTIDTQLILSGLDLKKLRIVSPYYDFASQRIFLGSYQFGLFVLTPKTFSVAIKTGKDSDNVYYAQITPDGRSILTHQGYLFKQDRAGDTLRFHKELTLFNHVRGRLFFDRAADGSIWKGYQKSLYRFDQAGRTIVDSVEIKKEYYSFYIDSGGKLWLGGIKDELFQIKDLNGKLIQKSVLHYPFGAVTAIRDDLGGTLWLGTENGIYKLNVETFQLKKIKGLENIQIRSIYCENGRVWTTTEGGGNFLIENDTARKLPEDRLHRLSMSHCIVEDHNGFFWIPTNKGLFQVSKQHLIDAKSSASGSVYFHHYNKTNGFLTNEFNGGCQPNYARLADGSLSLPSMDGLVLFTPESTMPELPNKKIFIDYVEMDGLPVTIDSVLVLKRAFQHATIQLSTPYYGNQENVQMQYLILSSEDTRPVWQPIEKDLKIHLDRLSSGNYIIKVRKNDGFSPQEHSEIQLIVKIPATWYELFIVKILFMLLLIVLSITLAIARSKTLQRREKELHLQRHYTIMSRVITSVSHDIQTPLHFLNIALQRINIKKASGGHSDDLANEQIINKSINTVGSLQSKTNNLVSYVKSQLSNFKPIIQSHPIIIKNLVSESILPFEAFAEFRKLAVSQHIAPELIVNSDHNLLSIIVHNLMDNAVKHSRSLVSIRADQHGNAVQLTISDDGPGMPESLMQWLNKSSGAFSNLSSIPERSFEDGVGLIIVKDLCIVLGYCILAQSSAVGTTIKVTVPTPY